VRTTSLPSAFEPDFYRQSYPDLSGLTDQEALEHFRSEGIAKGYSGSPPANRGHLLSFAHDDGSILEIGPFHAPSVVGEHVRYMDAFTTEELTRLVRDAGHDTSNVPTIHYVSSDGSFDMVGRTFAAVFSGHCIEHQPDLVRHLRGVSSVLEDNGRYYIACPDKRYCFDHYAPETVIVDVLAAYHEKRKVHQPRSFLIQGLSRAHNDSDRHWAHDHGPRQYEGYKDAKREIFGFVPYDGTYHDTHAWQFTPGSFFQIMSFLYEVGLTDLAPERVYHTRFGTNEFTAVLRKGQHTVDRDRAFTEPLSLLARHDALVRVREGEIAEHEALSGAHNDLITRYDALVRVREGEIAEHEALNGAHNDLITRYDALVRVRQGEIAERDALAHDHRLLIAERDALARYRDNIVIQRDALLASHSWRLTAPLRWMRKLLAN
jgi:hypothetical protein